MMRVLSICQSTGVSEFYRATAPYRMLADAGLIELDQNAGDNPAIIDHLHQYDAVVFSRADTDIHSLILMAAKSRGLRVIYDVDDNLSLVPPSIGAYGAWHVRGRDAITSRLWHFKYCIRQADVLTVSTDELGRQLCDGQPQNLRPPGDYLVLQNQVVAADWRDVQPVDRPPGEVWVGWWGIYNHWDDWRDIAPYISPVIEARPDVRLVIVGMPEAGHLFPELIASDQLIVAPFVQPEKLDNYRRLVAAFDVALAPTSDCPFNRSKSDLKLLQYGAAGVPVLASAVTYSDWIGYADIVSRPADWADALATALDELPERKKQANALRGRVLATRTYEINHQRWLAALAGRDDDR